MIMDIRQEHATIEARLAALPGTFIDFDGARVDWPMTDAEEQAFHRMTMLQDLMELKRPLGKTEWGLDMRFGMCPCTLALTNWLQQRDEDDQCREC